MPLKSRLEFCMEAVLSLSFVAELVVLFVIRVTLLLGPPASGKTTLLKALAGKLDKDLRVCHPLCFITFYHADCLCVVHV